MPDILRPAAALAAGAEEAAPPLLVRGKRGASAPTCRR